MDNKNWCYHYNNDDDDDDDDVVADLYNKQESFVHQLPRKLWISFLKNARVMSS